MYTTLYTTHSSAVLDCVYNYTQQVQCTVTLHYNLHYTVHYRQQCCPRLCVQLHTASTLYSYTAIHCITLYTTDNSAVLDFVYNYTQQVHCTQHYTIHYTRQYCPRLCIKLHAAGILYTTPHCTLHISCAVLDCVMCIHLHTTGILYSLYSPLYNTDNSAVLDCVYNSTQQVHCTLHCTTMYTTITLYTTDNSAVLDRVYNYTQQVYCTLNQCYIPQTRLS